MMGGAASERDLMLSRMRFRIAQIMRNREADCRASGSDELADEYMIAASEIERMQTQIGRMLSPGPVYDNVENHNAKGRRLVRVPSEDARRVR